MLATGPRLKAYLASARLVTSVVGVGQLAVLARVLSVEQYAIIAASVAAAAYIQLLSEPAVLGYERLGHSDGALDSKKGGARSATTSSLLALLAVGLPLSALLLGFWFGNVATGLAASLWAVSLVQLRWVSVQWLNWGRQAEYASVLLVNTLVRAAAMLVAAFLTSSASWALAAGACSALIATRVFAPPSPPLHYAWGSFSPLYRVGLPLAVSSASVTSLTSWPILVGDWQLPVEEFAAFAAQTTLAGGVYGASLGFILVFGFPKAKRLWDSGDSAGAIEVVGRYIIYVMLIGPLMTAAFWIFGDWLTGLLLGDQYSGHVVPSVAVSVACVGSVAGTLGWKIRLEFRQKALASIAVTAALMQIPVIWLAARFWSLPGLLSAGACVYLALALATVAIARPPRRLFIVSFCLSMTSLALAMSWLGLA